MKIIPIPYLCIHTRLVNKFGLNKEIDNKEIFNQIERVHRIPHQYCYLILKEMADLELIKRVNVKKAVVCKPNFSIEEPNKIYKALGLF